MNRFRLRAAVIASAGLLACGSPSYVFVHNPVATVQLAPALDTIPFGGSVSLTITTLDVNGAPTIPDHHPVWSSLNTAVLNVDTVGTVSSHWYGVGTIRAVVDGIEGDAVVVALPPRVVKVTVASPTPRMERGDTIQFQVTALNEALVSIPTTGAQWTVSDATKLRVDSLGRGIAVGVGLVTVRATFAGLSDSTIETVLVPAASVTLSPDSLTLAFGATDTIQIVVRDSAANVLTDRPVSVSTSSVVQAPVVLPPPATDLPVRGVAAGAGKVTVTVGHVRDSTTVSVGAPHYLSFTSAALGGAFTCGLNADSAAYCWGWGHGGELGTGDTVSGPQPRAVVGGLKFVSLTAGPEFACGLTDVGAAYCWGGNTTQQLGTAGGSSSVPTAVSGGHQYLAIDAHLSSLGDSTTGGACGLAVGGQVYCWGAGWGATPVAVGTPGFVDRLALGALGYCGVHGADTTAFCWSPTSAPARLAGWDTLPLALQSRGSWALACGISRAQLYCGGAWPDSSGTWQTMSLSPRMPVPNLENPIEAAAGVSYECDDVITTIVCRGDNSRGQLGTRTGAVFLDGYVFTADLPSTFGGLEAGWSHTCLFGGDGLLYCWGDNAVGQAGSTDGGSVPTPQPVLGQAPSP